jgi:hypothetical protein
MTTNSTAYLTNLHRLLDQHFSLEEIRTLCFDLGVDYDSVRGEGKSARIRELILALGRNGRLPELVASVQEQRRHIAWPPVPADFQLPASLESGSTAAPVTQHHYYGNVVQGDQVGGDKINVGNISGSQGIAIGRGASATVTTYQQGSGAEASDADSIAAAFARLYQAVNESAATAAQKAVAQQAVEKLEQAAQEGETADEAEVRQWFDVLIAMLPDIGEVAIDAFLNPIKGVSTVFRKIAAKARAGRDPL